MPNKIKSETQLKKERELRRMSREILDDDEYEPTAKEKAAEKISHLRRTYLDE